MQNSGAAAMSGDKRVRALVVAATAAVAVLGTMAFLGEGSFGSAATPERDPDGYSMDLGAVTPGGVIDTTEPAPPARLAAAANGAGLLDRTGGIRGRGADGPGGGAQPGGGAPVDPGAPGGGVVDLPDLPAVPDLPGVPDVQLPDLPDVPLPDVPGLPEVPDLPETPPLPPLPEVPDVPLPPLPDVPDVPVPDLPDLPIP
jgi:hypothetical protein